MNGRLNSFLVPFVLLVSLAALNGADALKTPAKKPNIVVFLADDMPWHYPGFNGGSCETSNLDRLAKEGTRLTQFYVHSVCSPTRAAFLTGRYPFRNGMEERSHGNDVAGMLPDERTLAQALKQAGYDTALIGKWHLGNWYQRQLPLQRGFDHHYGLYGALISYNGKTRGLWYDWHRDGETIREDGYTTDLFAREFERMMAARSNDKPFFYYVGFNAMHSPYDAPPALVEKYRKRAGAKAPPQELATLESMDTAIGKMIATMKTKGVLENTLIVFFSDNGGANANPPFRNGKGSTYEGGVRVPCVIHWPGHVPADKQVDSMVHVTDLYPTLLKLAGASLEQPLALDGMDMWDVLTGTKPSPRAEVVHNLPNGGTGEMGEMSICQGTWKLVGKELFDLSSDPGERIDLAAKHPEICKKLNARIQQLVGERRQPEKHLNIPDKPLLVFGEKENANPPAWLQPYLDSLPAMKRKNVPADTSSSTTSAQERKVDEPNSANNAKDTLLLENGVAKVGISRGMGAAITWLSSKDYPKNMVNSSDPGRLIQQSYYAGNKLDRKTDGQSKSWSPWTWNPIQGGGVSSWARVSEFKRPDAATLYSETVPKLWDMPDEEAAALMRQWTGFEPGMPNVIAVRCELVVQREVNDRWGPARPAHQEVPACYFTRNFDRVKAYLGNGQWRNESQPPGPPWGKIDPPRKAVALFNANGQGVAVFSPAASEKWNFGPHGGGLSDDPKAGPCMHVAPIAMVSLGPKSIYRYRYWLVVGTESELAARLDGLLGKYADEIAELSNPVQPALSKPQSAKN